ncbi:MAG: hypothetical protein D6765_13420, partial [Bacteroidetes bacterium]
MSPPPKMRVTLFAEGFRPPKKGSVGGREKGLGWKPPRDSPAGWEASLFRRGDWLAFAECFFFCIKSLLQQQDGMVALPCGGKFSRLMVFPF